MEVRKETIVKRSFCISCPRPKIKTIFLNRYFVNTKKIETSCWYFFHFYCVIMVYSFSKVIAICALKVHSGTILIHQINDRTTTSKLSYPG